MLINEEQKRRYTAFWRRDPVDRACLYLTSWDGSAGFRAPKDPTQQWSDLQFREEQTVYNVTHTRFHAEGFPSVFTNFGPGFSEHEPKPIRPKQRQTPGSTHALGRFLYTTGRFFPVCIPL